MHRSRRVICALAGTLVLAGCGGEEGTSSERTPDGGGGAPGSGGSGASGGWSSADAETDAPMPDSGLAGAAGAGGGCTLPARDELAFSTGWDHYDSATYLAGGYYLDPDADVRLEGLLSKLGGAPAQNDVIATLPAGHAPAERLVFAAYVKGYGRVDVNPNGELVWINGTATEKDYVSLSGISFRPGATSSSEWTKPDLGTWLDYGGSYAPAAYRKTDAGEVHLRGLVKKAEAASGETMFTLPEGYRPSHRLIFLVASSSATPGRIDVLTDGRLVWYPGTPGYVSVSNLTFHLPATSYEAPSFEGTWTNYGGTHAPAGYLKDCFGRVHLRGLVTDDGGAPAQSVIFTLPTGYRPSARLVFAVATRAGAGAGPMAGRVDVHADGRVMWMTGGTYEQDWTSLTGLSFVAEH